MGGADDKWRKDKKGKFGRMLCIVYYFNDEECEDGVNLNQELIKKGFAVEYFGKKKQNINILRIKELEVRS